MVIPRLVFFIIFLCHFNSIFCQIGFYENMNYTGSKIFAGTDSIGKVALWTGGCKKGYAEGSGTVEIYQGNEFVYHYEGVLHQGRAINGIYLLADSNRNRVIIESATPFATVNINANPASLLFDTITLFKNYVRVGNLKNPSLIQYRDCFSFKTDKPGFLYWSWIFPGQNPERFGLSFFIHKVTTDKNEKQLEKHKAYFTDFDILKDRWVQKTNLPLDSNSTYLIGFEFSGSDTLTVKNGLRTILTLNVLPENLISVKDYFDTSKNAVSFYKAGLSEYKELQYKKALSNFSKALLINKDYDSAKIYKDSTKNLLEKLKLAKEIADSVKSQTASSQKKIRNSSPPKSYQRKLDSADVLINKQKFEQALLLISEILKLDSTNAEVYLEGFRASFPLKQYGIASDDIARAMRIDSLNPVCYFYKGLQYTYFIDDAFYARKQFDKAISLNPTDSRFFTFRGKANVEIRAFKEAYKDFDTALSLNSTDYFTYLERGKLNALLYRTDSAFKDFEKAISLNPNDADIYLFRGDFEYNNKDYYGAFSDYQINLKFQPSAQVYTKCAGIDILLKNYPMAIENCDKALSIDQKFASAFYERGLAKREVNDKTGACSDFQKAKQLGVNNINEIIDQYCNH